MIKNVPNKMRARLAGVFIIAAYSMLVYDITKNITLGVITDLLSGLAVIGTALLMFPLFNSEKTKQLDLIYLLCKIIEGLLMITGGLTILSPALAGARNIIYQDIHIYFFILGASIFYLLLYRTSVVPEFISIWGICAVTILFVITIIKLSGITAVFLDILLLPMILNEIFLALWLIIKGFTKRILIEND